MTTAPTDLVSDPQISRNYEAFVKWELQAENKQVNWKVGNKGIRREMQVSLKSWLAIKKIAQQDYVTVSKKQKKIECMYVCIYKCMYV